MPKRSRDSEFGGERSRKRSRSSSRRFVRARRRPVPVADGSQRAMAVSRPLISTSLKRTFNYVEQVELDGGAGGTVATYQFSANSLYDPNVTSTGHQPLGFDEYVGVFYDHYTVIASKITVTAMARSGSAPAANNIVCITARDGNTPVTNIATAIEQGRTVYGFIGPTDGSSNTLSLTHSMNVGKFLGISNPMSEDTLRGTVGASPGEQAYWHISAAAMDASSDASPIDLLVAIEYVAVLTEPKTLTGS